MSEVGIARGSLKMPLLLFALLSTALAVPAPCPPMPPMDCGEGMINCPAGMDATKMDKMLINAFEMLEEKGQHVLNTVANCIDDFQVGVVQE